MSYADLVGKVRRHLEESAGFTLLNPTTNCAIASKPYDTEVGKKEASIYLSEGDHLNFVLYGYYRSEGRKALPSYSVLIPKAYDDYGVYCKVLQFVAGVDQHIAGTYAVQLLKARRKEEENHA